MESLVFLTFVVFYFTIYFLYYGKRSQLICKPGTPFSNLLTTKVKSINKRYFALVWGYESRLLTLIRYFTPVFPAVEYETEYLHDKDGGIFSLSWTKSGDLPRDTPIVLVAPGLTSTKDSYYISSSVNRLRQSGFRTVVLTYRGLDDLEIKTEKTYSATDYGDLEQSIHYVSKKYPGTPLVLMGASLGGILVSKYLKDKGADAPITSYIALSTPFNPAENLQNLVDSWTNFILLSIPLTRGLTDYFSKIKHMFAKNFDIDKIMRSKTIREYDEAFTAPQFGFDCVDSYYAHGKICHKTMKSIRVPTLYVNSDDDAFSLKETIPLADFEKADCVAIVLTRGGGHVSHLQGLNPFAPSYFEEILVEFVKATTTAN